MRSETCPTVAISIFIAGDVDQAKQVCREICLGGGLCVTVTPTTYIYNGGEEAGVCVGIINYPRFPLSEPELVGRARDLGAKLVERLCQHSYSIVTPDKTEWYSRREAQ